LQHWLYSLPDPLLGSSLCHDFIEASKMVTMIPKMERVGELLKKLPPPNRLVLFLVVNICSKNAKGSSVAKVRYTQVLLQSITDLAEALGPALIRPTEENIASSISLLRYLILNVDVFFPYGCSEEQMINKHTTKLLGLLRDRSFSESSIKPPLIRGLSKAYDVPRTRVSPESNKLCVVNSKAVGKDAKQGTTTEKSFVVADLAGQIPIQLEKIRKFCDVVDNFDTAFPLLIKLKTVTQEVENLKPHAGVITTVINKAATLDQQTDKITRLRTAVSIFSKECSIVVEGIKNNLDKLDNTALGYVEESLTKINNALG
jgi:hypothetical protein